MKPRRGGERGLSIMEAIVIATITALLALLMLPLLPRTAAGSADVAERAIDALDEMRVEREFRGLVRAVSQREIDGEPQPVLQGEATSVVMRANLPTPLACARPGAPIVRLAIENHTIFCESEGRRRVLLRWPRDSAGALAYSADGVTWMTRWSGATVAPYVRFEVRQRGRTRMVWVERVAGDPS